MMKQDLVVDAIRSSTDEVFSTMLGWKVENREPFTELIATKPGLELIAIVGFAGAWIGTASISCDAALACRISSAMLGVEYTVINEDVLDAISEITNMVVGNFKNAAENYLGPLGLGIPTVIYGLNFSARSFVKGHWLVVPFDCDGDLLEVKMCLTPKFGLGSSAPVADERTSVLA